MGEQETTAQSSTAGPERNVHFTRDGAVAVLTLDRPKALNALNADMRAAVNGAFRSLLRDPEIYAVILDSNSPKAFCAGGDVRELVAWGASDPARARQAFADEYRLDWLLECFTKPTVSLANGFVMGSGAGLTMYNTHRVAGENYAFAMPETTIGFFPDVGVANILARLPGEIGTYLGLTGARIGRDDAHRLGLVTHLISAQRFPEIRDRLREAWPIDEILDELADPPGDGELAEHREVIERCFAGDSITQILASLAAVSGADSEFAAQTLRELRVKSPTALAVTLRHLRAARDQDLRDTLVFDYRIALRFLSHPDFAEGVRAALIDKDHAPNWQPADCEQLNSSMVATFFEVPDGGDLHLPSREDMQNLRAASTKL